MRTQKQWLFELKISQLITPQQTVETSFNILLVTDNRSNWLSEMRLAFIEIPRTEPLHV